jgi:catechol 2,3-dioxygenase-like lactoylglutathione lyase family enzyme
MLVRVPHLFAGTAVSDFVAAREWYERLFGCPPDSVPKDGEAVWRPSPSASVYIAVDRARAGHGLLTLAVTSLADLSSDLARRGIAFDEGSEGNGMPTVLTADPDGNTIKFFEDPSGA